MKSRTQKQDDVTSLKEQFASASTVVVTHYHGMSVAEVSELRKVARKAGVDIRVSKNTLAKIAANETNVAVISNLFKGPTAFAISEDAVAAAKVVADFANGNEKLKIIGGTIDGRALDEAGVQALAKTPSLDQSRAKLVGLLLAPAQRIATVLQAPASQLARVCAERGKQSA